MALSDGGHGNVVPAPAQRVFPAVHLPDDLPAHRPAMPQAGSQPGLPVPGFGHRQLKGDRIACKMKLPGTGRRHLLDGIGLDHDWTLSSFAMVAGSRHPAAVVVGRRLRHVCIRHGCRLTNLQRNQWSMTHRKGHLSKWFKWKSSSDHKRKNKVYGFPLSTRPLRHTYNRCRIAGYTVRKESPRPG
jgi:hypothetical protein